MAITYDDKEPLNSNPNPEKNKWTADNANEVKQTVNDLETFATSIDHYRGLYDLSAEAYPTSGGTGAAGVPGDGDYWIGTGEGDFDVHGFEGPVTLFRGAMLIYIGGTVTDPQSWIVKQ